MLNVNENIEKLNLNRKIESFLKNNNILTIKNIISKSKTDFRTLGLVQNDISEIEIKAELQGFRLKGSL